MARIAEPVNLRQALESFVGSLDGRLVEVRAGDIAHPDSAVVARWPDKFGPVKVVHPAPPRPEPPPVEEATAAPGRRRGE